MVDKSIDHESDVRVRVFNFDNFAMQNKANSAYNFSYYCKKQINEIFSWSAVLQTIEMTIC